MATAPNYRYVEHDGKRYRIEDYGTHAYVDVYRLASRRTQRWRWVRCYPLWSPTPEWPAPSAAVAAVFTKANIMNHKAQNPGDATLESEE